MAPHVADHVAFRLVDHTADVAIEATAPDREAALAEAGLGLTCVLTGLAEPGLEPGLAGEPLAIEAPDLPALAVAFLAELLWLVDSEDLLWVGGDVKITDGPHGPVLEAWPKLATLDPTRHGAGVEVKAVTYHGVVFEQRGAGWTLQVLLDI